MAQFDAQQGNVRQTDLQQDQARISYLEQNVQCLSNQLHHLQNNVPQPPQLPQQISRPNLNLHQSPLLGPH